MRRNGIQSGNRVFPANRAIGLLQPIGQLFLNRAGCPNRAIARIGNWMPIVQSVPIGSQSGRWSQSGEKTSCSNVLHAAQMRHDVRRQIFCHTATMVWSINTQVIQIVAAVAYFYLVANELQGLFRFLSCSQ